MNAINPSLPKPPPRIAALPIDERGFPVPWFATWFVDGEPQLKNGVGVPDFRHPLDVKKDMALAKNLCWICGQPLGVYRTFVIGPMCVVNRNTAEPPNHYDCANYAARACPFLAFPRRKRDKSGVTPDMKAATPGIVIERNPGVSALYTVKQGHYGVTRDGLIKLGNPTHVQWWTHGRMATRGEVLEAINTGLPLLEKYCFSRDDREALAKQRAAAEPLLPQEAAP